jgi:WD40 repeat protein
LFLFAISLKNISQKEFGFYMRFTQLTNIIFVFSCTTSLISFEIDSKQHVATYQHNDYVKRKFRELHIGKLGGKSSLETTLRAMPHKWCELLFELIGSQYILEHIIQAPSPVYSLTSLNPEMIAAGCKDGNIYIYHIHNGTHHELSKTLRGHAGAVFALAKHNNGKTLISQSNTTVKEWDTSSGTCFNTYRADIGYVAFKTAFNHGQTLGLMQDHKTARFLITKLKSHTDWSLILNEMITVAYGNKTIKLWNQREDCGCHVLKVSFASQLPDSSSSSSRSSASSCLIS